MSLDLRKKRHIAQIGKEKDLDWFINEMEYNQLDNRHTADLIVRKDGVEYKFEADYLTDLLKFLKELRDSRNLKEIYCE